METQIARSVRVVDMSQIISNLTLVNVDISLLQEQYEELLNTTPGDSIVWGLIECLGNALESKGVSYEPDYVS
jgi:hypothetical protein